MLTKKQTKDCFKVVVLGASGYSGGELLRILSRHNGCEVITLTAERHAGKTLASVFPNLAAPNFPDLTMIKDVPWKDADVVFSCLPHGMSQKIVQGLPKHIKVIDLSADFRLFDVKLYESTYGSKHLATKLQQKAVYGLTEISRSAIIDSSLVACPGCYPTATQLPLIPLLQVGAISHEGIIVDAKSGVSGAGREATIEKLYAEVNESIKPYGIGTHRHTPEIEQGLSKASGKSVTINFTPHLIPMNRGILSTIYADMEDNINADKVRCILEDYYRQDAFVHILQAGDVPSTSHVTGTNNCLLSVFPGRKKNSVIIISAIDNLVKGASGQAVQNFNLMFGFPETTGIKVIGQFP